MGLSRSVLGSLTILYKKSCDAFGSSAFVYVAPL
jgi:hypothetical protein